MDNFDQPNYSYDEQYQHPQSQQTPDTEDAKEYTSAPSGIINNNFVHDIQQQMNTSQNEVRLHGPHKNIHGRLAVPIQPRLQLQSQLCYS